MFQIDGIIFLIVALIDGLLFGIAIKKGVTSFILIIIALIISSYIGLSFVPHLSITDMSSKLLPYIKEYGAQITSDISLGLSGSLSLTIVLFIIGLGVGIWKG